MMTQDEITTKIDELQTALNQINNQLIQANPQAQNVIGQLNAYNQLLAEPEKELSPDPGSE
jgi:F0F1-type ATP synthase membrane subunit b/b'